MNHGAMKCALLATVLVLVMSIFAQVALASGPTTNKLAVEVTVNGQPAPAKVNVTVTNPANGAQCVAPTGTGGYAFFTSTACPALQSGWWSANVEPQVDEVATGLPAMLFLPATQEAPAQFYSASLLASGTAAAYVNGVKELPLSSAIHGNVTYGGSVLTSPVSVRLLDASFPGFVIASTSQPTGANFALDAPQGTWTLVAAGNVTGATTERYNYTMVSVTSSRVQQNLSLGNYLISGSIEPTNGVFFTNPVNLTLYQTSTTGIYSRVSDTGSPYFQMGDFATPSGGANQFLLFLAPVGYSTSWAYVTASAGSPSTSLTVHVIPDSMAPTQSTTVISFPTVFTSATVNSWVNMTNDSTFPVLANSTVGDLWAQIGLDFGGGVPNATTSAFSAFRSWLNSTGPIYPVDAMGLAVNGTSYNDTGAYGRASTSIAGTTPFTSSAGFQYNTSGSYQIAKGAKLVANGNSYNLLFGFDYATAQEAYHYRFVLPTGYVLSAGTQAPAGTSLVPSGPGNTWTSFTLIPGTSYSGMGSANFTVVKYSKVTAIVNVTSSNFAFSAKNILNSSRSNYTALVGEGQPVDLSAANSLVPAFLNVTKYTWNFGDGSSPLSTTNASVTHIYNTSGKLTGSVTLLANGGETSQANFTLYVGNLPPTPYISLNDTHHVWNTTTHQGYVYVNWSNTLRFNATGSTSTIASGVSVPGILSVALWNVSAGKTFFPATNFSISTGAKVTNNWTFQFLGAGPYVAGNTTVMGQTLPLFGWVYKVTLTLWDAGGNRANATLWVLVNDTEKPVALGSIQNAAGQNVTSVTEGPSGYAVVTLVDKFSYDPHNGSIAWYNWTVKNAKTPSINKWTSNSTKSTPITLDLNASLGTYNFTLTVADLAGNRANVTLPLTVAVNATTRPILQLSNMSAPGSMQEGSSYTIWVNVTNNGGNLSIAHNVSLVFYLTDQNGNNRRVLAQGSQIVWYNDTTTLNGTAAFTGLATIHAHDTFRAEAHITAPSTTGSFTLWANATATNEFPGAYISGANVQHTTVTINANPLYQDLVYVAIAVVVVVIIVVGVIVYRRRSRGPSVKKSTPSKSSAPAKPSKPGKDEDDDEDTD